MSNKTSDENVANVERLNNFANMTFLYGNRVNLNVSGLKEIQQDLKYLLAEREQKDKRIKELEEESRKKSIELICYQEELENSIPIRVITDLIENETIDISGFECIAVEDLQELLEGRNENG